MVFKKLILLMFLCNIINARTVENDTVLSKGAVKFRFDFTYHESIRGWLKMHQVPATWKDAMLLCHAEGAVLASPLSKELKDEMVLVALHHSISTIFTGVHTTFGKGVYASVEGVPLERLPISWAVGDPDNINNSESCLAMQAFDKGNMKDTNCSTALPFICYLKRTKFLPINECGTHDTEYNLDTRTGKCYKFHRDGVAWPVAYMTCMAEGGYLAIINSNLEATVIKELYAQNPDSVIPTSRFPYTAHLGIQSFNGLWMTIHGQTLEEAGYNVWEKGEPNNGSPEGEFCGGTQRAHGLLNDFPCSWVLPFICEKELDSLDGVQNIPN